MWAGLPFASDEWRRGIHTNSAVVETFEATLQCRQWGRPRRLPAAGYVVRSGDRPMVKMDLILYMFVLRLRAQFYICCTVFASGAGSWSSCHILHTSCKIYAVPHFLESWRRTWETTNWPVLLPASLWVLGC